MLVFQPDGSLGLYTFPHVALAVFVAVVAAMSLQTEDPLRLRGRKHEKPIDMTSAASAPSTSESA